MVPEPMSVYMGKKVIDLATSKIEQLLTKADEESRSRIERCAIFLDACSEAITGLEKEYEAILVQTINCPNTATAMRELKVRIDEYLRLNKLRLQLHSAITGLKSYHNVFAEEAESILKSPLSRTSKQKAVEKYGDNLNSLDTYYKELESQLEFRPNHTGICQEELHAILKNIKAGAKRRISLQKLGEKYFDERDKEPMYDHVRRIREVTEEMRKAFG